MQKKVREIEEAIRLRKAGYSYKQIRERVPIAKSSLSLYLSKLPLNAAEKKTLRRNIRGQVSRGRMNAALANTRRRLEREENVRRVAQALFTKFQGDQGFHVGIALYWAEGAKRAQSFSFINTDEAMVRYMCEWCRTFLLVKEPDVHFRLYVSQKFKDAGFEKEWAKILKVPLSQFKNTSYKKGESLAKKRPDYKGCLRIELGPKRYLLIVKFWIEMQRKMLAQQAKVR